MLGGNRGVVLAELRAGHGDRAALVPTLQQSGAAQRRCSDTTRILADERRQRYHGLGAHRRRGCYEPRDMQEKAQ
jgi:hypothetical protein